MSHKKLTDTEREFKEYIEEQQIKLKHKIRGCDEDIKGFKDLIRQLENKKKAFEFKLRGVADEWFLKTRVDYSDKWKGKRRPTGCK